MNPQQKEQIVNLAVDKYYFEPKNPLVKIINGFLGNPTNKKEMKEHLLK